MQCDDAYFKSAIDAAAARSYRVAARFDLSPADREDLQQELMLDLIEHASQFDPAKGSAGTFTGLVSQHRSVELLDQLMKDRGRLCFFGNDAANDNSAKDDPEPHDETRAQMWADNQDLLADSAVLLDLETALAHMSDEQLVLLSLLNAHGDLPSACRESDLSSATFYRRVTDLQMHLRMFGFKAAA